MKAPLLRTLYLVSVFFLAITGFGQMPLYKRYYISSLPGLGWLADFYVTHWMHYLAAAVLMGLVMYVLVLLAIAYRKTRKPSVSGMIRGIFLAGLIITGVLLVLHNLPGTFLSRGAVIFLDLAHLGLAMAFLAAGAVAVFRRMPWTTEK